MLLATEPLWAAIFAGLLVGEGLSGSEAFGGALIIAACVASAADGEHFGALFAKTTGGSTGK